MADDLPSFCDVIVIGTGLVESIVAAAVSRIGKEVLHFDYRDYYGGSWGTLSTSKFIEIIKNSQKEETLGENELGLQVRINFYNYTDFWYVSEDIVKATDCSHTDWSKMKILQSRQFNLDLLPKVIYSSGDMVEVLINSGISRYSEFKMVAQMFSYDLPQKQLMKVPCSRADVFNSTELTMVEKRLLMKTLTKLINDADNGCQVLGDITIGEFLTNNKVEGKIRRHLVENVGFVHETENYNLAAKKIKKFVKSIGRFGDTPLLWPLYGSGELPSCFCRCSAVYGGVYCLNQELPKLSIDDSGKVQGINLQSKTITASSVVVESSLLSWSPVVEQLSRAVLITNKSLTPNCSVALVNTQTSDARSVRLIELSASSMACPQGLFVVHLVTTKVKTAQEDLEEIVHTFFSGNEKDSPSISNVLWCSYFNVDLYESCKENNPQNLYSCPGPTSDLDMDGSILEAKAIFNQMFPNEEFLPRIPDPEEVSYSSLSEDAA